MDNYFGAYADFKTASKADAGALLGADNMVGDVYDVVCEFEGDVQRAWLVNRFDKRVGYFDADVSRKLNLLKAKGLAVKAVLSFVAFTDHPDEGFYWGNMAIIAYPPSRAAAFERFVSGVALKIGEGVRPRLDLDAQAVERVIESDGSWLPKQTVSMPAKEQGTAIMKSHRSLKDKMIEQARAGNKGCYVGGWAFLLALVALAIFGLKSCFVG